MSDTIILDRHKCNAELLTIHADGTITAAEHLKPTETAAEVLRIMRETWMADAQSIKIRDQQERIKRLEEDLMDAKNKHAALVADVALYEDRGERIKRLEYGIAKQNTEIEQTCGKVLDYPWYKNDQKNFPSSTEVDGVCVGEHIAETIASELARKYTGLKQRIKRLEEALEGTVKCFVDLADSGDAGFWNPDEQSVIIAARAALEAKEAKL